MIEILGLPWKKTGRQLAPSAVPADAIPDAGWLHFKIMLMLVLLGSGCLYVSMAASWAKFSRAEVFFAECAREMLSHNNLITPLYHGQPFFDKPILAYWLIVLCFKTFGISHLVARLPSMLAALLTVALTGVGAKQLFGFRAGLLASMALASSFMFLSFASLCMSDMLLVMFDCLTMSFLYAGLLQATRRKFFWWLAAASMGLAFLTKGPVGIVLPALAFIAYLSLTRQISVIKPSHLVVGAITATLIVTPWFLAAYQANGIGAIAYFFIRENFQRFAGTTYDTHKPIWFMTISLLTGFAPWSVFLPAILWNSLRRWRKGEKWAEARHELYLWSWIAVVTGFFSLSRGQCDYYVLPAYPAAAMLVGTYLAGWISKGQRPALIGGWGLVGSYIIVGVASSLVLSRIVSGASAAQWLLMPISLTVSGALMGIAIYRKHIMQAYAIAFAGICLAGTGFALQILPAISHLQLTSFYSNVIRNSPLNTKIGVDASLAHWVDEITFQTGREPVRLDTAADLEKLLAGSQPVLAIVPQDQFQRLPESLSCKIRVAGRVLAISHALTPGYAIKRHGNLTDPMPLILVTNQN